MTKDRIAKLEVELAKQDIQLESIHRAEKQFELTNDINKLIKFWEKLWTTNGLLFRGSHWTLRLTKLYIQEKQYDNALRAIGYIERGRYADEYKDMTDNFKKKVEKMKNKKQKYT